MSDSGDTFGEEPGDTGSGEEEAGPTAAELEAAGQNALFGEAEPVSSAVQEEPAPPPQAPPTATQPYRVLARKYRPQTFAELIGQEPMVRTLSNAIARERLAHAFLMTGVRGVGKTSTARLIAKALNCIGPDGSGGPTIDPCGVCEPCVAIAEGRHMDVIEMDAASHTGVDDVREIIEAVRYAAVSARYKIYIIDEVHMLSRNAFNALLKTLEEPPAHVKFLFATTEVEKLPVTVLSRTQRFDLRRITAEMLQEHFAKICALEGVEAEEEALALIASAAEGSVRDGLSILDQAIAHADMDGAEAGATMVRADKVRDMLGLADKGAQRRVFAAMLEGDPAALLDGVAQQYALGVEPLALLRGLMDLTHRIAVTQIGQGEADAPTAEERAAIAEWSGRLTAGQVHRLWQLLLKGHDEVRGAPDPLVAAKMALLRALHAADMPDPGKMAKDLQALAASGVASGAPIGAGAANAPAGPAASAPDAVLEWRDLAEAIRDCSKVSLALSLYSRLENQLRVIALEDGKLVYCQPPGFDDDLTPELKQALLAVTGKRWDVSVGTGEAAPTLVEQEIALALAAREAIENHPFIKAAREAFPEAEIIEEKDPPSSAQNWSRRA